MHYYQFNIGDYKSHTAHLEPMEDLAYRRMIDLYILSEEPLPLSVDEIAKKICMRSHCDCISSVLHEFFAETEDGFVSKRCEEEIERANKKSTDAKKAADKRWRDARKKTKKNNGMKNEKDSCDSNAPAMRSHSDGNADAMPHITHNTRHITQDTRPTTQESTPQAACSHSDEAREIVSYLNSKTGASLRHCDGTTKLVSARINDGATVDEIKRVIDLKCGEWLNDKKMHVHLVPKTLFRKSNYDTYAGMLGVETPDQRNERETQEWLTEKSGDAPAPFAGIGTGNFIEGEVISHE